jgi:cyanuric acid amidohydrolase
MRSSSSAGAKRFASICATARRRRRDKIANLSEITKKLFAEVLPTLFCGVFAQLLVSLIIFCTAFQVDNCFSRKIVMASINILKFGVSSPSDTSPLNQLKAAGYSPDDILAVIGKSEGTLSAPHSKPGMTEYLGNGCVNDFSRTLSSHVWEPQIPRTAVTVFSGGTEGVLSPHVTFVVRDRSTTGLQAAVGRTRIIEPHEIGTSVHALEVASSIRSILKESGVATDQVRLILIKCPLLTSEKVEVIKSSGRTPITTDTYDSMAKSRYSSALGIAIALE